jgi:hypothetical protein
VSKISGCVWSSWYLRYTANCRSYKQWKRLEKWDKNHQGKSSRGDRICMDITETNHLQKAGNLKYKVGHPTTANYDKCLIKMSHKNVVSEIMPEVKQLLGEKNNQRNG